MNALERIMKAVEEYDDGTRTRSDLRYLVSEELKDEYNRGWNDSADANEELSDEDEDVVAFEADEDEDYLDDGEVYDEDEEEETEQ